MYGTYVREDIIMFDSRLTKYCTYCFGTVQYRVPQLKYFLEFFRLSYNKPVQY